MGEEGYKPFCRCDEARLQKPVRSGDGYKIEWIRSKEDTQTVLYL